MESFEERLCRRCGLTKADVDMLISAMRCEEWKRGEVLVREGRRNTGFYIIAEGIWRASYINSEGNDMTLWFASQGEILFSSWSYVANEASMLTIEAMSDSVLYTMTRDEAETFFMSSVEAARIARRMYEKQIFELDKWLLGSGAPKARERYLALLEDNAELLQYVPLKHIASYLFITPQSLSRIRSELVRGKKADLKEDDL